jgi:predicted membrane channel-forming protein YqfA (hemolysin III family)
MRFRLWHWMAIVLVAALAGVAYRLWPRQQPRPLKITVIEMGSLEYSGPEFRFK